MGCVHPRAPKLLSSLCLHAVLMETSGDEIKLHVDRRPHKVGGEKKNLDGDRGGYLDHLVRRVVERRIS